MVGNPPVEIGQVGFRHIVVGQHRGEREQHDGQRHEPGADAGHEAVEAFLDEAGSHVYAVGKLAGVTHRTVLAFAFEHLIHVGREDDERGCRAHKQCARIYRERLHEALLRRVRHLGGRRRLRTRALTCLVGVNAALHAPHDGRPQHPREHGLPVERRPEDQGKHVVNMVEIDEHDNDCGQDVDDGHERHHQGSEVSDPLHPAHDNDPHQHRRHGRAEPHVNPPRIAHGVGHPVRLNTQEEIPAGQHHAHRKNNGVHQHEFSGPRVLEGFFNIVGRPTPVLAGVLVFLLIYLGESAFHEGCGGAKNGNDPHPEHGTRAAVGDGGGYPGNIADADPTSQGDHQCLKRRHPGFGIIIAHHLLKHVGNTSNLHEQRADGEENPHGQAHKHQCRRPNNSGERIENSGEAHNFSYS